MSSPSTATPITYYRGRVSQLLDLTTEIKNERFRLLRFGHYGSYNEIYYPAELACGVISLEDGLLDIYSSMVYPGPPVPGFLIQMLEAMKLNSFEKSDFQEFTPTEHLRKLHDLVPSSEISYEMNEKPLVFFTKRSMIPSVEGCMSFLQIKEEEKQDSKTFDKGWEILPLEILVTEILARSNNYEATLLTPHVIQRFFISTRISCCPELTCEFHQQLGKEEGVVECSTGILRHWAYTMFHVIGYYFNLELKKDAHFPDTKYYDPCPSPIFIKNQEEK